MINQMKYGMENLFHGCKKCIQTKEPHKYARGCIMRAGDQHARKIYNTKTKEK